MDVNPRQARYCCPNMGSQSKYEEKLGIGLVEGGERGDNRVQIEDPNQGTGFSRTASGIQLTSRADAAQLLERTAITR